MAQPSIFAKITPKPEYRDTARETHQELVPKTLQEPECNRCRLLQSDDGSHRLYEDFENEATFEQHHAMPYTQTVFVLYATIFYRPIEVVRMQRLA